MAIIGLVLLSAAFLFSYTEGNTSLETFYTNYQTDLRTRNVNLIAPGEFDAEYKNVTVDLQLIDILKVDVKEGYTELIVWIMDTFTDPQLKWNPEEYGGVNQIRLPRQQIWIPDWEIFNPLAPAEYFGDYKAVIYASGAVARVPVVKIKVKCQPLDDNDRTTCGFKLGSWIYNADVVSPVLSSEKIALNDLRENQDWSVINTTATRHDKTYSCCPSTYPTLEYTITLEKRSKCKR